MCGDERVGGGSTGAARTDADRLPADGNTERCVGEDKRRGTGCRRPQQTGGTGCDVPEDKCERRLHMELEECDIACQSDGLRFRYRHRRQRRFVVLRMEREFESEPVGTEDLQRPHAVQPSNRFPKRSRTDDGGCVSATVQRTEPRHDTRGSRASGYHAADIRGRSFARTVQHRQSHGADGGTTR